jgi:hypothetical protein
MLTWTKLCEFLLKHYNSTKRIKGLNAQKFDSFRRLLWLVHKTFFFKKHSVIIVSGTCKCHLTMLYDNYGFAQLYIQLVTTGPPQAYIGNH